MTSGQAAFNLDLDLETQGDFQSINNRDSLRAVETTPETAQIDNAENASSEDKAQGKGRPRSEKSRQKILKATNALLLHTSVQELSIEAIAKKAKVGKTTIYRWWPNKAAVVMEALISQPGLAGPMATPKNNAEAIQYQLERLIRMLDSKNGDTIAQLFAEAQANDKARAIFTDNFLAPLVDAIEYSLIKGRENKEFRSSLDIKMAIDMLCGPIFFRLMAHPHNLNEDFCADYPKEVLRVISA